MIYEVGSESGEGLKEWVIYTLEHLVLLLVLDTVGCSYCVKDSSSRTTESMNTKIKLYR